MEMGLVFKTDGDKAKCFIEENKGKLHDQLSEEVNEKLTNLKLYIMEC
jgi:hypothetical protein